ncbi:MBL fold metallo-hydrolase [Streptomyces roseochromogenus]|uniref:Zn-dependent hydrolase n=1 Tax=Streptomyces roseochromogenus subsp. oscitans DS 12.976 TaxID=1352936 RepID=V6JMT8_STRRC|nr:MBL fold metallo-hydrolase [Streptomyces roseochromogenus]EST21225.1 Zn-dependent hydrolase [Streptomyces roseochromogenus subsp. oscitans DS 12.976]
MKGAVRIERVVTRGTFSLDGDTFDVENNVWLVGDDEEVLVVDAAHDAEAIHRATAGRRVTAVLCTHAHDDHIDAADALATRTGAPVLLHPDDHELWSHTHPARKPDGELTDGQVLAVAGMELQVIHTPGHTWGSCCLYIPFLDAVFTGDTLFHGGPGATGRSYSDRPAIEASIRARLLTLPGDTVVHTGHGPDTTIAAERPNVPTA